MQYAFDINFQVIPCYWASEYADWIQMSAPWRGSGGRLYLKVQALENTRYLLLCLFGLGLSLGPFIWAFSETPFLRLLLSTILIIV